MYKFNTGLNARNMTVVSQTVYSPSVFCLLLKTIGDANIASPILKGIVF